MAAGGDAAASSEAPALHEAAARGADDEDVVFHELLESMTRGNYFNLNPRTDSGGADTRASLETTTPATTGARWLPTVLHSLLQGPRYCARARSHDDPIDCSGASKHTHYIQAYMKRLQAVRSGVWVLVG